MDGKLPSLGRSGGLVDQAFAFEPGDQGLNFKFVHRFVLPSSLDSDHDVK